MTSAINTGTINVSYPTPGVNNSSQGFRDNFTGIKDNFDTAATEITDLQNKAILKSALTGTVLDNDMNNGLIKNAKTLGFRASTYNLGTNSGSINIDLTLGDVQIVTIAANSNLTFSKWAPTGTGSSVEVIMAVTAEQTIGLPYTAGGTTGVIYGTTTIEGYSLTGTTSIITVPVGVTRLHFKFNSIDCGDTIEIVPVDRPRQATQLAVSVAPASASATGIKGQIAYDSSYIYVCTATNTWKRTALTTW